MITVVFLFSLVVRLILALVTYHHDLNVLVFAAKIIVVEGHWLNFYTYSVQYLNGVPTLFPHNMVLNYQPLAYLIPSLIYLPFSLILKQSVDQVINDSWNHGDIYLPLLIYKLPLILADILIFFLIPKMFKTRRNQKIAQLLWALNPIAIYVSSMIAQVDIIIALFIVLSLISYKNKKYNQTSFFLALAALVKPSTILIIPFLLYFIFLRTKKLTSTFSAGMIFVLTYLGVISPYLGSVVYRHYALFADQLTKSTIAGISIVSGHDIPWFFITYTITAMLMIQRLLKPLPAFAAALLASLAFTHFHPQWLLWLTPFFIFFCVTRQQFLLYWLTLLAWIFIVLSFDSSLHLGLFYLHKFSSPPFLSGNLFNYLVGISRAWLIAYLVSLWLPFVRQKD